MDIVTQKLIEKASGEINVAEGQKYEFDLLQLWSGFDYKVDDYITIRQPTMGDIIRFGEKKVSASILPFVTNPTSFRLQLWDMGVDWNEISDFDLFIALSQELKKEDTSLIFGDFDFSILLPRENSITGEKLLIAPDGAFFIDEDKYMHIREYIRLMFNQYPKVEKAKGKTTKQAIIDEERMKLLNIKKDEKSQNKSIYLPLISSMVNHPGFKYRKDELDKVGIYEFMDSVQRLQVYESTTALMKGIYSGFIDTSKMDLKNDLNWLKDLH